MTRPVLVLRGYTGTHAVTNNYARLYHVQSIEPVVKPEIVENSPLWKNKSRFNYTKAPGMRFVISGLQPRDEIDELIRIMNLMLHPDNYLFMIVESQSTVSSFYIDKMVSLQNDGHYFKPMAITGPETAGKGYINYKVEFATEG